MSVEVVTVASVGAGGSPGSTNCIAITTTDGNFAQYRLEITLDDATTLSWWDAVSTETGYDFAYVRDGDTDLVAPRSGITATDWTSHSVPLAAGAHVLTWRFEKDGSEALGRDAFHVANIRFGASGGGGGPYSAGALVKHNHGLWLALTDTDTAEPVEGAMWTLLVQGVAP